jgi:serine/threonine protein kinase
VDTLLRRDVVVKEITVGDDLSADEREGFDRRVLREARAVARIAHPSVATLFDVVQEDGRTFVVTERVEARTLAEIVESDGPLAVERVAALGHQLVAALQAAHRRGIVHRRVGPDVIVLLPDGRVRLTDFGIALQADSPVTDQRFAPPPEVTGVDAGAEADVWALGATLMYAVEGSPPTDLAAGPLKRAGDLEPALRSLLVGSPHRRPTLGAIEEQLLELGRAATPEPKAEPAPGQESPPAVEPAAASAPGPRPAPAPATEQPRRRPTPSREEPANLRFQLVPPEQAEEAPGVETGTQPRFVLRAAGTLTGEMPRVTVDPGLPPPAPPELPPRPTGAVSLGRAPAPPAPPPGPPEPEPAPQAEETAAGADEGAEPEAAPAPGPEVAAEAEQEPEAARSQAPPQPGPAPGPVAELAAPAEAPPAVIKPRRVFDQPPQPPVTKAPAAGNGTAPAPAPVFPPGHPLHPGTRHGGQPKPLPQSPPTRKPQRPPPGKPQELARPPIIPGLPEERAPELPTVAPGGRPSRQGRALVLLSSIAVGVTLAVIVIIAFLQLGREDPGTPTAPGGQRGSTQTTVSPTTVQALRGVTPSNWQPFIDPQFGWRIAVPSTWEPVQDRGGRVSFRDPASGAFVRVERAEGPLKPLVREAERAERTFKSQDGYERLKLESSVYKGVEAVEWEFRYRDGGGEMHAADLHLLVDDVDYVISYQAPEATWGSARPILERIRNSFEAG